MAKEKNKPVPVRFDLKLLEVLKEEEKIETPQQALNFLSKFWENNRPAREGFGADLNGSGTFSAVSNSALPSAAVSGPASAKSKTKETATHPSGLSGIDLSIWKAEQKEKSKNG
jgi:hypothetical protein